MNAKKSSATNCKTLTLVTSKVTVIVIILVTACGGCQKGTRSRSVLPTKPATETIYVRGAERWYSIDELKAVSLNDPRLLSQNTNLQSSELNIWVDNNDPSNLVALVYSSGFGKPVTLVTIGTNGVVSSVQTGVAVESVERVAPVYRQDE